MPSQSRATLHLNSANHRLCADMGNGRVQAFDMSLGICYWRDIRLGFVVHTLIGLFRVVY
jgi:hypothetical protein